MSSSLPQAGVLGSLEPGTLSKLEADWAASCGRPDSIEVLYALAVVERDLARQQRRNHSEASLNYLSMLQRRLRSLPRGSWRSTSATVRGVPLPEDIRLDELDYEFGLGPAPVTLLVDPTIAA